jgi:hypothetical protein
MESINLYSEWLADRYFLDHFLDHHRIGSLRIKPLRTE